MELKQRLFLAPTYQQADYWARQLGYGRNEWKFVNHRTLGRGYRSEFVVVYLCGTWYEDDEVQEILDYFAVTKIECIMAEDMVNAT